MILVAKIRTITVESTPIHTASVHTTPVHTMSISKGGGGGKPYEGEYEVTPGEEQQVLATKGSVLAEDIVVHPIPAGYGRISFDGNVLTVW